MNEKELINQIIQGDQKATERFCRFYRPKLIKFVSLKIDRHEDVEEIVQDVLLDALDSMALFRGDSALFSWICAIARHNIADFYRRQKIKRIVFSKLPWLKKLADEALSPEFVLEKKELQERFYRVMHQLPEGFSQILRLKYIDGLSVQEAAERLNISFKAAESMLFRARQAYQQEYVKNYPDYQKGDQILTSFGSS